MDVRDAAFCGLGTLCCLAMALWLARALMRCNGAAWFCATCAAAREALSAWKGAKEEEDDVSLIVRAKVEQQKLHQFCRTCSTLSYACGIWTFFVTMNIIRGLDRYMYPLQDVAHIVLQGIFVVVLLWPNLVTPRSINIFYVSIALGCSVYVSPYACAPELMFQSVTVLDFVMTILVVSRRNLAVTVPMNFIYAVSTSATVWIHGAACVARPERMATGHFVILMSIPIAGSLLETAMRTLLRQGIEMEGTKELLGAACALLRSVCDVVVELDASGVIAGPAHDLGTFLLKGPMFRFQDHKLADFLSNDEDKRMFERKLHVETPNDGSGVGLAEALHVRMKDSDRNLVRVEIFSFKYRHLDSKPRFMVGLREFADNGTGGGPKRVPEAAEDVLSANLRQTADNSPATGSLVAQSPQAPQDQEALFSDSGSEQEASGATSATGATGATRDDPTPAVVTVDTTAEGAPVRGLSAGFQMRIGRLPPETRLLDLVDPDKMHLFGNWLRAAARYGSCWPASRLNLSLRQGRVRATIRVFQEQEGEPLDPERVQLIVSGIKIFRGGHTEVRKGTKPYTDFRGTPSAKALHMTL